MIPGGRSNFDRIPSICGSTSYGTRLHSTPRHKNSLQHGRGGSAPEPPPSVSSRGSFYFRQEPFIVTQSASDPLRAGRPDLQWMAFFSAPFAPASNSTLRYSPGTPRPAICPSALAYFPFFSTATCRPLRASRPSRHFAHAAGPSLHNCHVPSA